MCNDGFMKLFGTHGTSEENARRIHNSQFFSRQGRGGTGIYFWRRNEYSVVLSKGWYDFYLKKHKYDKTVLNNFAYINAKIDVHEDNFLDFESVELKDKIASVAFSRKLDRKISEEEIAALYDYFIKRLEKELDTKFYVWQLRVNAPYTANDYPLNILGNPICYVVNNNDIITILDCYVVEGTNERKIF